MRKASSNIRRHHTGDLSRRQSLSVLAGAGAAPLLSAQQQGAAETPRPETPAAASVRTKELSANLKFDVPPPIVLSHSISYRLATRKDADSRRLDVYRNDNFGKEPVIIFFHGGAWRSGHRRQYIPFGVSLALKRMVCVLPSYSKAPDYPFPEPVIDAASVVSWVYNNIRGLGGDPEKIFLAGHSSGVQIAALTALDPRYLQFHYLEPSLIRGVICISGIYDVSRGFDYAFGTDPELRSLASPMDQVRENAPPFLLLTGSRDADPVLEQTPRFVAELHEHNVDVETELYPEEDHNSMLVLASIRKSPIQKRIEDFVDKHS